MKKFALLITMLLALGTFSPVSAAEVEDVRAVARLFAEKPYYALHEDLSKFDFPWHWSVTAGSCGIATLAIIYLDYQQMTSPGRQLIRWVIYDYGMNGVVDRWTREYYIEDKENTILLPDWPEGFRNMDWIDPPRDVVQKLYDECIHKLIEKEI